jgi:hypothetical protein
MGASVKKTIFLAAISMAGVCAQTQDANRSIATSPITTPPPYVAMTARDRLNTYLKGLVSPVSFLRAGASAGWGQLRDRPKQWGEGGRGYGRRYASSYAQHVTSATLLYGASSLLHEDNRYVRLGPGPTTPDRVRYALESSFQARHDDGTRHFSYSKMIAFAGAAAISRAWQPHDSRTKLGAVDSFAVTVGVSAGFTVLREFLPDLLHRNK